MSDTTVKKIKKSKCRSLIPCDEIFMTEAIKEAAAASHAGEVPVGAVLVHDGIIIARGRNCMIGSNDPSGHAEMDAIRKAAGILHNYRLTGSTLYVTLEPCVMCSGAIIHARIARVVYGTSDPKAGAVDSVFKILTDPRHNHHPEVTAGILRSQCQEQLSSFFKRRRAEHKKQRDEQIKTV